MLRSKAIKAYLLQMKHAEGEAFPPCIVSPPGRSWQVSSGLELRALFVECALSEIQTQPES
jgi:hypothetical protein